MDDVAGPLVSIIVSCYNAGLYIGPTLTSLLGQSYHNIEIVIVNDGSTDNSEEIIRSFKDGRIRYYFQQNKGQCAALNYGYSKATGALIKFYDADDILSAGSIAGQVSALQCAGPYDMSFIEWRRFYNNQVPQAIDQSHLHTIHRDCSPFEYITHYDKPPMYQCGLWLMPRTLLVSSGLWNEQLSLINDTEFFTRILSKANRLFFSENGYTLYRTIAGSASLSADFSAKGIRSAIKSIDLSAKWYLSIENSERIKRIIVQSYTMVLEWAYPKHTIYSKIIENRIRQYTGRPIELAKSGKIYNVVMKLLGWKVARRFSKIYYKLVHKR